MTYPIFLLVIACSYLFFFQFPRKLTRVKGGMVIVLLLSSSLWSPLIAQLSLLADVNSIFDPVGSGADPRSLVDLNGTLFFNGRSEKGYELWKSDGINSSLVKDIYQGSNSSNPGSLTIVDGVLYFIANDGLHGPSLFKSDGTEQGTTWIKDLPMINFLINSNLVNDPAVLIKGTNIIYFATRRGNYGDLWRTDGTTAGTYMLFEGFIDYKEFTKAEFTLQNGALVFRANGGSLSELWRSDGTISGTTKITSFKAQGGYANGNLITVNGTTFFTAFTSATGNELWKTDGTEMGTVIVRDITATTASSTISELVALNEKLVFNLTNGPNAGVWTSDGTTNGTVRAGSGMIRPGKKVVGNSIYYVATNLVNPYQLWSWNDSNGQTLVANLNPYITGSPVELTEFNGLLYFIADKGDPNYYSKEIWRSDGTTSGTYRITDFPMPTYFYGKSASCLTSSGTSIYFTAASEPETGNELWKTNGTIGNLTQLTDLPAATENFSFYNMGGLDGQVYFGGRDNISNYQLVKSDGTTQGTIVIKNIPSPPQNFTAGNHHLLFNVGGSVWRSDGSSNGTFALTSSDLYDKVFLNGAFYFPAPDATYGVELKKSEYPYTSTQLVADVRPGPNSSDIINLITHKNSLYFLAYDGSLALWKSDGTAASTVKIKSFSYTKWLISSGQFVYFVGNDGIHGQQLWRSDGTTAGTIMLTDVTPGVSNTNFKSYANVNGVLYFVAEDAAHGAELWKSDGSPSGTMILSDIWPGTTGSNITSLSNGTAVSGGRFYFAANDGVHGKELWMSDGTPSGTKMVTDINPGAYSSDPLNFNSANGAIYFTAYDNTIRTLWKTNGIGCSTSKVTNNTQVVAGGEDLISIIQNNNIYISGWTADVGNELRLHDMNNDLPIAEGCKAAQNITFDALPDQKFGGPSLTLNATSSLGLPIQFTTTTPQLISIQGNQVTLLKAGTASIIASQQGNTNIVSATPVIQPLIIGKADQTVNFTMPQPQTYGTAPLTLAASASSGLPVTYTSSDPSIASIFANVITFLKPGTTTITAQQNGDENFLPAQQEQIFTVDKAIQRITLAQLGSLSFGSSPLTLTGTASSGLQVSYESSDPSIASITGNVININKPGSIKLKALQEGNEYFTATQAEQIVVVNKAQQQITFNTLADQKFITSAITLQAQAGSGLTVTYVVISGNVQIANNQMQFITPGRAKIQAQQNGNEYYSPAPNVDQSFCIVPLQPVLTVTGQVEVPIITSSFNGNHQWYKDGILLNDQTGKSLQVISSGTYTAKSIADDCISSSSDAIPLIITEIENSNKSKIQLFPNPVTDQLTIQFSTNEIKNIQVFSIHGHSVLTTQSSEQMIKLNTQHLASGIYVVRIDEIANTYYLKFVIK